MKALFSLLLLLGATAHAAGTGVPLPEKDWSFEGLGATWDKDQLYRGYKVATQVCMACHSFKYISHRTLMDKASFTEEEAKALAAEMNMPLDAKLISGLDETSAQESYGTTVPDLSVMNKARAGLADYVYALLLGYGDDAAEISHALPEGVPEGAYYNRYFPGYAIAMPSPLAGPDMVTYHDKTEASVAQMAEDVTYFMQWTAEPELMERKNLGVYVLLYLLIFTLLAYLTKRAIWKDVH
jgi:cytochrome c1